MKSLWRLGWLLVCLSFISAVQGQANTAPVFLQTVFTFNIPEDSPPGTFVGNVLANDNERDVLTFSIQSTTPNSAFFAINSTSTYGTAVITAARRIDRENLGLFQQSVGLTVRVDDSAGASETVTVSITILDINDNHPVFLDLPTSIALPENTVVDTSVFQIRASDNDQGLNAQILFRIEPLSDTFTINPSTGDISLVQQLDYDAVPVMREYFVTVVAEDRAIGNNSLTTISQLTVIVTDINDLNPVFDQNRYMISVHENLTMGSPVIRVNAADGDTGVDDDIVYSITAGNLLINGTPSFFINTSTGWISVNVPSLDREEHPMYRLAVRGNESNSPNNQAFTTVEIEILDINDHVPTFEQLVYVTNISELTQVNGTVLTLTATDNDEGSHGEFTITLLNITDEYELPFTISSTILQPGTAESTITLSQEIDFEMRTMYRFMVVATETLADQTTRSGSAQVTVYVDNENDNDPMFAANEYSAQIQENVAANITVVPVSAMDADAGSFGEVVFRLSEEDMNKPFEVFTLLGGVGVIRTTMVLDYEQAANYTLTLIAEDLAANPLDRRFDIANVTISVTNLNDNPPLFVDEGDIVDSIDVQVPEEIPSPYTIETLQVFDADGTLNDLYFEIVSATPNLGHFKIDRDTGVINTTLALDFDLTGIDPFPVLNVSVNDTEFVTYLQVNIEILDINDNSPQFDEETYSFDVVENTAIGGVIGLVQATDDDSGTLGRIEYSISGSSEVTDRIQVNSSSGEIYVIANIDREETPGPFNFTVIATDLDSDVDQRTENTTSVTLYVTDLNDNSPVFGQDEYAFQVAENTLQFPGLNVSASDSDAGSNADIVYTILGGNEEGVFLLDPMTAVISHNSTVPLDFERTRMYVLNVSAADSGNTSNVQTVLVNFIITDENDETPTFSMPRFNATISEDVPSGFFVTNMTARDDDSEEFGTLTYSIGGVFPNRSETFVIEPGTGVVRTSGMFDRESSPGPYLVTIDVQDGGSPPLSGSTTLEVFIQDVNDERPTFEAITPINSPNEEQQPGFAVAMLRAIDDDEANTDNSNITYSITGITATPAPGVSIQFIDVGSHFMLRDEPTGVDVFTNASLDYEQIRSYEITVAARDNGDPVMSSEVTFPVEVVDINDNAPQFIFIGNDSYSAEIAENNVFVRFENFFAATDADSTTNGEIDFVPSNETTFPAPFSISNDELIVEANSLDFEQVQVYRFNVTARDRGTNALTDEVLVEITVLDRNDNPPVFSADEYITEVDEGNYVGNDTLFAVVNASDIDSGMFGNVSYDVFPENPLFSVITVEGGEGEMYVVGELDREMVDEHTITILARDGGVPPNTATATVRIFVNDVNDNAPVLNARQYFATISEGTAPALLAELDISASDEDIDDNGQVLYMIENNMDFEIDMLTADVRALRVFDFEQVQSFVLSIVASDNSTSSPLFDEAQLIVNITDINDNTPFFVDFPANISLSEDISVGDMITVIGAEDNDSTTNAQLVFQLTNDEGRFAIDENGVITLAASLDREATSSYNITVTVSDRGQPPESATNYLYVEVTDINDVSPQLDRTSYNFLVAEDVPLNTTVGVIQAFDLDEGMNGNIEFEIVSGNTDLFSLRAMQTDSRQTFTAYLVNNEMFDYETVTSYFLRVTASNVEPPYFNMSADITVTIRDTNDNPPVFSMPGGYIITVPEAAIVSRPVGTVVATDEDGGINSTVVYQFAPDTDTLVTDTFSINMNTGIITLSASLNFENLVQYTFTVEARDLSVVPLSSNVSVVINVEDTNEDAPIFDMPEYSASLEENRPSGSLVTRVNATEQEGSGSVVYSLEAGATQPFAINNVTGVISTTATLDREMQNNYVLTVEARDMATFPLSSFVQVVIEVLDANDNVPEFGVSSPVQVQLAEHSPNGTRFPQVFSATDDDIGSNQLIRYSVSPTDTFTVDPVSGVISVQDPTLLDREATPSVSVTLQATDSGFSPQASQLIIEVVLDDINDNSPIFMPAVYTASIRENSEAGSLVAEVTAEDADEQPVLQYAIASGDDVANKFRIDPSNGRILTTTTELNREDTDFYELVITATDNGTPARTGTGTVIVTVLDINDNPPQCPNTPFAFSADEANSNQVVLGLVRATDGDGPDVPSGQLVYQLDSSNLGGVVSVSSTGTVFGEPGLDFEAYSDTAGVFSFNVLVRDQPESAAGSSRSDICTVMVTLRDTNDNIPVFEESLYEAAVVEDASLGHRVIIVSADDLDFGNNGEVRYRIPSTSVPFDIDAMSGEVTVSGLLDSETNSLYVVEIEARDLGSPSSRVGVTTLRVTVVDVDDNSPRFDRSFYEQTIAENVPTDSTVLTVQATDIDSGPTDVQHSILSGNVGNTFRIERTTGVIQNTESLDREAVPEFNLVILAEDDGGNNGTTLVRVVVADINDEDPIFRRTSYIASINENSLEGTAVLPFVNGSSVAIQAVDADEPNTPNSLVIYTLDGQDSSSFSIDSATGIVTVARGAILDFETDPVLDVIVVARDSHPTTPRTGSVMLTVNLIDVNDVAPEFSSPFGYVLLVSEDRPINTVISTELSATDTETVGGMVRYELTSTIPFSAMDQFSVNRTTGHLSLLRSLDRETDSAITLVVAAFDMGVPALTSVVNVLVTVEDVNDNPPRFPQDIYTTTVPEFLAMGGSVLQVTAMDPDATGMNSEVRYEVLDTTMFFITEVTGVIVTTTALDYERARFHEFRVRACDQASPMECSTTMIRVNVADFNDNPPIFDGPVRTDICYGDAPMGMELVQPVATDRDSLSNAELVYSLSNAPSFLTVDPVNGRISVTQTVVAADIDMYDMEILATDRGDSPLSGSTTVTIRVLNCSEHDFYFTSPFRYLEIREGLSTFTTGVATVTLPLSRHGAQLQAEFVPDYPANPFVNTLQMIQLKQFLDLMEQLREGNGLDREARSLYTVTLRAQDGPGGLDTYTSVTLEVLDTNDNPPEFPSNLVIFSVPENQTAPYTVGTVTATDLDEGSLTYRIQTVVPSSSPVPFTIDSSTGLINTTTVLDREEVMQYDIIVQASDGLNPDADVTVRVPVLDINDCDPTFIEDEYSVPIIENTPAGTRVATVAATDCDDGLNAELRYTITAGTLGTFSLDLESGVITTLTSLDFEQVSSYSLTVTATDMGLPTPRSGTVNIIFDILDFNDCPPEFLNPDTEVRVSERLANSSVIQRYSVRDCDSGLNGVNGTRYSIVTGNEEGVFSLDPETGVLSTAASLDREERASYVLTIRAMDSAGIHSLSSITELRVIVEDENDNSPQFARDDASIRVSEGRGLNQILLTLTASDDDIGSNSQIRYSLVGGEDTFSIDETSGGLFLVSTLDRETNDSYVLSVVARDNGLEPRSSNATVFVSVTDENDNDPEITNIESGVTTVEVPEDADNGTDIFRVNATDQDIGPNANIIFFLDDESANLPFALVGDVIQVNGSLDFEQRVIYSLVVIAEDTGEPTSRRSIATLVVRVTDSNDNNPMFVDSAYMAEQDEGVNISTSITRVQANDADTGDNAAVSYSFAEGFPDTDFFTIDNATGTISNNITLDREDRDMYFFMVVATNYLTPDNPLSGMANVTIRVGDVNDETPRFLQPLYTTTLAERTPVGNFVFRVSAEDNDLANSPNSDLVYSLARFDNVPFFIDPNTGVVVVQNVLDYESATFYDFDVVVEDKGMTPLRNTSTVLINITDVNDQAPTFSQSAYTVRLPENRQAGTLLTLRYSDGDTVTANTESSVRLVSVEPQDATLFSVSNDQPGMATITINEEVDFESIEGYSLRVQVQNNEVGVGEACPATEPNCMPSSTAEVTVDIVDLNDNAPMFLQSMYTGEISSNALTGTSILAVRANDADSSPQFRSIVYRLGEAGPNTQFRVGNTTGTLFTRGSFESFVGAVYTISVEALDNNGVEPFLMDTTTVKLTVLRDFQRIAIIFNTSVDIISAKENEIVSLLHNLTGYEIVVEQYREYSTDTLTTFIFHAIRNGDIIDFDQFISENLENELFVRLERCRIIRIQSFGDVIVPQGPLDRETIVILVLCFFLLVGSVIVLVASFSQRYRALHANRNKILADVFYGSHAGSSLVIDNIHQENIQLELMEASGQTTNKQNPMFVQPYDNWAGVDTSGVESVGGDSNLQRDNPLYESQEIRMEMFADVSDEEEDVDEADEAELLAAALQDDSEADDEDNSVTAI